MAEPDIIEFLRLERGRVILELRDYSPWHEGEFAMHWQALQERLRFRLSCVECRNAEIRMLFAERLPLVVEKYLSKMSEYYRKRGYELTWCSAPWEMFRLDVR